MLSCSYHHEDSQRAVAEVNQQLRLIQEWGTCWQVSFAPRKTQAIVVSQSLAASKAVVRRMFGTVTLPHQDYVRILGVDLAKSFILTTT